MIQVTELRIGNYCRDKVGGEWMKIIGLDDGGNIVSYVLNRERFPLPNGWQIEGIPLTPELLGKCGFENQWGDLWSSQQQYFNVFATNSGIFFTPDHHHHMGDSIKSLHQLQNLFYALTDTELIINL